MNDKNQLLSMTEFVLDRTQALGNDDITQIEYIRQTMNAAKFLSQTLEKWMFVPCDDAGKMLQEIKPFQFRYENRREYAAYREAKERCYFDGWKYVKGNGFTGNEYVYSDDFSICLDTLEAFQYVEGGTLDFQLSGNTINAVANVIKGIQLSSAARKFIFD